MDKRFLALGGAGLAVLVGLGLGLALDVGDRTPRAAAKPTPVADATPDTSGLQVVVSSASKTAKVAPLNASPPFPSVQPPSAAAPAQVAAATPQRSRSRLAPPPGPDLDDEADDRPVWRAPPRYDGPPPGYQLPPRWRPPDYGRPDRDDEDDEPLPPRPPEA